MIKGYQRSSEFNSVTELSIMCSNNSIKAITREIDKE